MKSVIALALRLLGARPAASAPPPAVVHRGERELTIGRDRAGPDGSYAPPKFSRAEAERLFGIRPRQLDAAP